MRNPSSLFVLGAAALLGLAACSPPSSSGAKKPAACGNGVLEEGEACEPARGDASGCRLDCTLPACGDGILDEPVEACDDGDDNGDTPGSCRAGCVLPRCGDGIVDPGEGCDDGPANADRPDAECRTNCALASCGDGVVDPREACDQGPENSDTRPGACRTTCVLPRCGDEVTDPGEACDAGRANDDETPDACRETCAFPSCGDGVRDSGEACDEGTDNGPWPGACRSDCTPARCGDGVVDPGERCDDGAANSDVSPDACRTTCVPAACGDGVVDAGETCDDGAANSDTRADACRTTCAAATCGDGVIDAGEACDDGPANSDRAADACRTSCAVARCGDGATDTGEACDDGPANGDAPGACRADCVLPRCGDTIVDPGEACDDGNRVSGDGCDRLCVVEAAACGNGTLQAGEECDDGNRLDGDGCSRTCFVELPTTCGSPSSWVIDLRAVGTPDGNGGYLYSGDTTAAPSSTTTVGCQGTGRELLLAYPVTTSGDLVVEVTPANSFDARVAVRTACAVPGSELGCVATDPYRTVGTRRVLLVPDVSPANGLLWILVDGLTINDYGTFDARVAVVPPLPPGAACRTDRSTGRCAATAPGCSDPDRDGAGTCVPVAVTGGRCDPTGLASMCPEGHRCQGPAGAEVCVALCGNGVRDAGEQCDDGNAIVGDGCTPTCEWSGDDCASAFELSLGTNRTASWDVTYGRFTGEYVGSCGNTVGADAVVSFRAPRAGRYGFHLGNGTLWLWDGVCGPAAPELACVSPRMNEADLAVNLAANQQVYLVADSGTGTTRLTVARPICGDGFLDPGEVCEDGNAVSGDNCSGSCDVSAGTSCANPWRLAWDPARVAGPGARWIGKLGSFPSLYSPTCAVTVGYREAIAAFTAPATGTYAFWLPGGTATATGLSLRTSCTAAASEQGCQASASGDSAFLARGMVAGETVYAFVEGYDAFDLLVDPVVCGDGRQVPPEHCDDGNTASGDGCSATCTLEAAETEPNDTHATSNALVAPALVRGTLAAAQSDVFSFQAAAGHTYRVGVFAGAVEFCQSPTTSARPNPRLRLGSGTATLVTDLDSGPGYCPAITWTAPASGTYYLTVDLETTSTVPADPYFLRIQG